jgi:threonine dehydrogenase-like Zn-dependent dehydrogenase
VLAAVLHGCGDLRVDEVPTPSIREDEVLLRCRAVAICGTDVRIYRHGHPRLPDGTRRILGHELAGEVADVGQQVQHIPVGMRAAVAPNFGCGACRACRRGAYHMCPDYGAIGLTVDGGMAQYVRIPGIAVQQGALLPMPDGLSFEEAALNEPLACVYNGQARCPVRPGDVVLIVGAGPIGMMHLLMSRHAGAGRVLVADLVADRLRRALELGADDAIDSGDEDLVAAVRRATDGRGADVVIAACPSPQVQQQAVQVAADQGRISFFGGLPKGKERISLDSNLVHYKELTITGSHGCCKAHCERTLAMQADRAVDVRPIITHRFPLAEACGAMQCALSGRGLKTVLQP